MYTAAMGTAQGMEGVATSAQVEREVVELHAFFVEWFGGRCPNDDATYEGRLAARLSDDFFYVMPGGESLTRETLLTQLRAGYGRNPAFGIEVRDIRVRFEDASAVLATYEERQTGARNSAQSDNRRLSTVLFVRDGTQLRWHHIHETWLP